MVVHSHKMPTGEKKALSTVSQAMGGGMVSCTPEAESASFKRLK